MKKTLTLISMITVFLSFAGCGAHNAPAGADPSEAPVSTPEITTAAADGNKVSDEMNYELFGEDTGRAAEGAHAEFSYTARFE